MTKRFLGPITALSLAMALGFWARGITLAQTAPASKGATSNATAAPDPSKAPLIDELFQVTKPEQAVRQSKEALANAAQQGFDAEVRKFADPSKYSADKQKMLGQLNSILNSRLDWSKLKGQFAKVYSDNFSKDELSAIVAFYKSPAGTAEVQKMPKVNYQCNLIGQQSLASIQPELQKTFADTVNSIRQRAKPAGAAPASPSGAKPPASSTSPK